ncbi:MAG TPA: hypothetical protein VHK67_02750 [Rhabdochlamydiaceae bacterium]|nr:hypothetical protein [Rhabdochlamydiaceae bacterium]
MEYRIIVLIMALTTFFAYPLLSGSDRKHVAPLPVEEADDELEPEDEDEPVMMEDEDDDIADLQLGIENESLRKSASDSRIGVENQHIKSSASDPQLSIEDVIEED